MKITLYSTNCPKCKIIEKKLNSKNINYEICTDVDLIISKGIMSAPALEVDGVLYNFVEANQKINEM